MRKILAIMLLTMGVVHAERSTSYTKTFTQTDTFLVCGGDNYQCAGLRHHAISWALREGTMTDCHVKSQYALSDGGTKYDLNAAEDCSSGGMSTIVNTSAPYIYLTVTHFERNTGTAVLDVTYAGWKDNPSVSISNLTTDDAVGADITVNPVVVAGKDDSDHVIIPYWDPCQTAPKTFTAVNHTAATSATIIVHTDNLNTYFCSVFLVSDTAQTINVKSGTGTNCDTNSSNLFGGGTNGIAMDAKMGFILGNGGYAVGVTAAASQDVCIASSSTGQISGVIGYVKR